MSALFRLICVYHRSNNCCEGIQTDKALCYFTAPINHRACTTEMKRDNTRVQMLLLRRTHRDGQPKWQFIITIKQSSADGQNARRHISTLGPSFSPTPNVAFCALRIGHSSRFLIELVMHAQASRCCMHREGQHNLFELQARSLTRQKAVSEVK